MRVRLTEFVGNPQELIAVPGLVRALRLAILRDVRAPGVPRLGPHGSAIGQSRVSREIRRARIAAVVNGRAMGGVRPSRHGWYVGW
jgi:hypothetical protein